MIYNNSSFWLDDDFLNDDVFSFDKDIVSHNQPKSKDPVKLSGYRRAIGNFVRIVTGQPIPVRFTEAGDSYTDGESVTISASLKDKDFDPAVGLALHEGSHIKLTDFNTLKTLEDFVKKDDEVMNMLSDKHESIEDRWMAVYYAQNKLKDLINIIEDRRIDNFIYRSAPGYRGYYEALYDKYFNAKIIDKGLKSDEYRDETWESYMFRICNMTNVNTDLDALNVLRAVYKMINVKNIARLKNTNQVRNLAWKIFKMIEDQIPAEKTEESDCKDNQCENGEGTASNEEGNGEGQGNSGQGGGPDDGSKAEGDDAKKGKGGKQGGTIAPKDLQKLNDRQKQQLKKAIEKQKQFNKGETKKTKISKALNKQMKAMENSGVEIKDVEYDIWSGKAKAEVTVIRNFNKQLIDSVYCDMWLNKDRYHGFDRDMQEHQEWIAEGIRKGVVLGKKLKVRAEERNTKFNRQRSGRIDKRMIANAGFGAEAIFAKIESFAYNPGLIHISIDNSGSMSGTRFEKAQIAAVAIAKACSMIENMDCIISYRSSAYFGGEKYNHSSKDCKPIVLIAYDSRVHGMTQIKTMLPYMDTANLTPEGLCFDAIMKDIVDSSRGKDSYFVNMCDGAPYYNDYYGDKAVQHTKAQVKKMKYEGIKVISYFITSSIADASPRDTNQFKTMYGKDSQFVDTNKIAEIARTMNNKFLETA
jgi:hypothetical protein